MYKNSAFWKNGIRKKKRISKERYSINRLRPESNTDEPFFVESTVFQMNNFS
jgi:hypothetical protein